MIPILHGIMIKKGLKILILTNNGLIWQTVYYNSLIYRTFYGMG